MANSGKHRRHRKRPGARLVTHGGLVSALVMVGVGVAVEHTAAGSTRTTAAGLPDVTRPALPATPASRDLVRPPLVRTAPVVGPRIDLAAIARAKKYIGARGDWAHLCLAFVRTTFRLPAVESTAIGAWHNAKHKHRGDKNPPAGVPVFWSGGYSGAGHVAVSLGGGWIVSTDLPYTGHIAKASLSEIHADWGLNYLGWTEDLEGVRIYTP
jgi:hypothetical protein